MGHDRLQTAADEGPTGALVTSFKQRILQHYGARVDAVILYGSYLRGAAEAMPDFHVLLDRYPRTPWLHRTLGVLLPPNVHQLAIDERRAKVNVLTTKQLRKAVTLHVHPYFWARFAQPSRIIFCRDEQMRAQLRAIRIHSAERLLAEAGPDDSPSTSAAFWRETFAHTYAAELRSEKPGKREMLYRSNQTYYDQLFLQLKGAPAKPKGALRPAWPLVQLLGKALSALRIVKSALTFEDPVDYMLWKLERHSGVRLHASERQRRHPLLFAWPLIWRLYRLGAFR